MDQRFHDLSNWVQQLFEGVPIRIEPASGDASFRRYFRLSLPDSSYILMDAPPDKEDSRPFIRIAAWLHAMGVTVPEVLQQYPAAGFYMLTDLGIKQYLGQLNADSVDKLYRDAIDALLLIQQQGATYQQELPPYDLKLLNAEMQLFVDWFLQRHLGTKISDTQMKIITTSFAVLTESALAQPKVFVHRDYHSRNLMLLSGDSAVAGKNPGILDFQDAVWGPVTYDLVSLLRDCYIQWPDEQIARWVRYHFENLHSHALLQQSSLEQFRIWFDLMGMQRHLKATGIFARLNYRDNKPGYLSDIPRTLGYVFSVCENYPALKPFAELLTDLGIQEQLALLVRESSV